MAEPGAAGPGRESRRRGRRPKHQVPRAVSTGAERILGFVQDLEAFGIGLHHPVLDAVVDHLNEVASPVWTEQSVAVFWRQRLDDGFYPRECLRRAAGHDRVTDREPPDATAGAAV